MPEEENVCRVNRRPLRLVRPPEFCRPEQEALPLEPPAVLLQLVGKKSLIPRSTYPGKLITLDRVKNLCQDPEVLSEGPNQPVVAAGEEIFPHFLPVRKV